MKTPQEKMLTKKYDLLPHADQFKISEKHTLLHNILYVTLTIIMVSILFLNFKCLFS